MKAKYLVPLICFIFTFVAVTTVPAKTPIKKSYYVSYRGLRLQSHDKGVCPSEEVVFGGTVVWRPDGVSFTDLNLLLRHIEAERPDLTDITILGWYEILDERIRY